MKMFFFGSKLTIEEVPSANEKTSKNLDKKLWFTKYCLYFILVLLDIYSHLLTFGNELILLRLLICGYTAIVCYTKHCKTMFLFQ